MHLCGQNFEANFRSDFDYVISPGLDKQKISA